MMIIKEGLTLTYVCVCGWMEVIRLCKWLDDSSLLNLVAKLLQKFCS